MNNGASMNPVPARSPEINDGPLIDFSHGLLRLSGYALRIYLLSAFVLVLGLGLLAGCYASFIAMDGALFRGIISGVLASGVTGVLGFVLAFKITVFYTAARAVKQSALGTHVLQFLLKTEMAAELPAKLDYSEEDLRRSLVVGGARINQRINLAAFPRLMQRVIKGGTKLVIRLVAVKIMNTAGVMHAEGRRITKDGLLAKLADQIDQLIIDELRGSALRFIIGVSLLALLMIGLCAHGMRLIPSF